MTRLLALLTVALASAAAWLALGSHQAARGALPLPSALNPPTDLPLALSQGTGQTPATAPVQQNAEPPLTATPPPTCGPGSNPVGDPIDGRVTAAELAAPAAAKGYNCNLTLIGHQGQTGGFKVFRYIDSQGHECAFYDTALLFPTNAINLGGPSLGVAVLDMTDPAHPVQTDTLTEPPMMSPHESLSLNAQRGLLAAVLGNPATQPGLVSIYSVAADCRHPVLDSTQLAGAVRTRGQLLPRRQHVLRGRHLGQVDHRDRRHRPDPPEGDLAGQRVLARADAQRRRRPRLRGRPDQRPAADPRHLARSRTARRTPRPGRSAG